MSVTLMNGVYNEQSASVTIGRVIRVHIIQSDLGEDLHLSASSCLHVFWGTQTPKQ